MLFPINPFLTITSILIDQVLDYFITPSRPFFYLFLINFSLDGIILLLLFIYLLFFLYYYLLLRCESIINSSSSFYIPIYQEIKLLFTSYWFKSSLNLIEVLYGFNFNRTICYCIFISSIELINFGFILVLIYFNLNWITLLFILFSSSLWSIYFFIELQWMLLSLLLILGNSVYKGFFNYYILNNIISIYLMIGLLFNNSIFFVVGFYGKLGFFPFIIIYSIVYNSASYLFILLDYINKWTYINLFIILINTTLFINLDYILLLFNLFLLLFILQLIISIKHLLVISYYITFIYYLLLLMIRNELIVFYYCILLLFYLFLFIFNLFIIINYII
jgi:hypothetical protein